MLVTMHASSALSWSPCIVCRANTIGVDPTASETDDELNPVGQLSVAAGTSTNGPANPTHVTSATMNQGSTKKASTLIGGSSGSSGTPALSSTLSGGSSSSSGTIGAAGTRAGTTGSGSAAKPAATSGGHRSAAGASAGGGGEVGGSFSGRKLLRSSVAGVAAA
jgi:hypothetical protein